MSFSRFKVSEVGKVSVESTGLPWATIEQNGNTGVIMHLGAEAVRQFELGPNDTIMLAFDEETHRMGFRKHAKGDHVLTQHGGSAKRLKVSITAFYRAHLEGYGLELPFKADIEKQEGWISFGVKRRKQRSDIGVARGPYKSRQVEAEVEPVKTRKQRKEAVTV